MGAMIRVIGTYLDLHHDDGWVQESCNVTKILKTILKRENIF
jgi:hypothetical protein